MIRNELAEKLGISGYDVKQKLVRSGGDVMDWDIKAYNVRLMTKDGEDVVLLAMGVDEISSMIEPATVKPALEVFPQISNLESVRWPNGKVDLLIGLNYLEVQPWEVAREGGLSLWESRFGSGYLLGGTHPDIWLGNRKEELVAGALQISRSTNLAT